MFRKAKALGQSVTIPLWSKKYTIADAKNDLFVISSRSSKVHRTAEFFIDADAESGVEAEGGVETGTLRIASSTSNAVFESDSNSSVFNAPGKAGVVFESDDKPLLWMDGEGNCGLPDQGPGIVCKGLSVGNDDVIITEKHLAFLKLLDKEYKIEKVLAAKRKVVVFDQVGQRGNAFDFDYGRHASVPSKLNDKGASIWVSPYTEVMIYKDPSYKGDVETYQAGPDPLEINLAYKNTISSIKVFDRKKPRFASAAVLFQKRGTMGKSLKMDAGRYSHIKGINDSVNSVWVQRGHVCKLYADPWNKGDAITFTAADDTDLIISDITDHGFEDGSSSAVVWNKGEPGVIKDVVVTLFNNSHFKGPSLQLTVGEYYKDLKGDKEDSTKGARDYDMNDHTSSIKVASGYEALVYYDPWLTGKDGRYAADQASMSGWANEISSIKVQKQTK